MQAIRPIMAPEVRLQTAEMLRISSRMLARRQAELHRRTRTGPGLAAAVERCATCEEPIGPHTGRVVLRGAVHCGDCTMTVEDGLRGAL